MRRSAANTMPAARIARDRSAAGARSARDLRETRSGGPGPAGSRSRAATVVCPARSRRNHRCARARTASRSPCTPASRPRPSRGGRRSGWRGSARAFGGSGASSSMSSSKVRLASSIIANSSPRGSSPEPPRSRATSTGWGRLPSESRPSASASRRAGSIVTSATRRPSRGQSQGDRRGDGRLADAAGTGADHDALAGQGARPGASRRAAPASRPARRSTSARPSSAANRNGKRRQAHRATRAAAAQGSIAERARGPSNHGASRTAGSSGRRRAHAGPRG